MSQVRDGLLAVAVVLVQMDRLEETAVEVEGQQTL